jgi:hypothetical protein
MKQLTLAESLKTMDTLFKAAKQTMFKAEVLQDYTAVDDGPSLRAWLDGDSQKSRTLGRADRGLIDYREACLASPASITRVHIVEEPYTPYLEWEIAVCYKDSLLGHSAEKILLVNANKLAGLTLPAGDFWLFDDKRVLQWKYEHGNGKTVGAKLWDESQGDDIDYFRQLRKSLLDNAKPVT